MPTTPAAWGATLSVLAAAGLAHVLLGCLGRRLGALARRGTRPGARSGEATPMERAVLLGVLALRLSAWTAAALWATEALPPLRALSDRARGALDMSLRAPLFMLEHASYSAFDLLTLPLMLGALWLAASLLAHLVRTRILAATGVDRGARETVAVLLRYAVTIVGSIVLLQEWGIDVSSLTMLASVIGLGLGFGLQSIANNFVSGLLLSLERPIKAGDFVTVGGASGTVERIGARSVEIRTRDRVTILVPSSRLLESEVVNWSHGDPVSRLRLPVGVAYGSDVATVRAALLEAARSHGDVLTQPRPTVEFRAFGDNALHFELLVWTSDPMTQERLKSDLLYRIEANLRRHGLEVPFPQRDVHLRAPRLERLLATLAGQPDAEAALAPACAVTGAPDHDREADDLDTTLAPSAWSDAEIAALVARMRAPGGVAILDRKHLFSVYPRCFVGREAVDWIARTLGLGRDEAVGVGEVLMARGVLHHVLDEQPFRDGHYFYRFVADEPVPAAKRRA
jgi:small-conductance mechanosensitive channel